MELKLGGCLEISLRHSTRIVLALEKDAFFPLYFESFLKSHRNEMAWKKIVTAHYFLPKPSLPKERTDQIVPAVVERSQDHIA